MVRHLRTGGTRLPAECTTGNATNYVTAQRWVGSRPGVDAVLNSKICCPYRISNPATVIWTNSSEVLWHWNYCLIKPVNYSVAKRVT